MTIVAIIFLAAREWLPRAQWPWLFSLEVTASRCEITLEKLLPHSLFVNLMLLATLFAVNLLHPAWEMWTTRFRKAISLAKTVATVLAVFTSFTFFGYGQADAFLEATAEEKYERLKDQSTAVAELFLAARLSNSIYRIRLREGFF